MQRLALLPLVFASACVASSGDEGFEVVHNLAVTKDTCSAEPGGAFLSHGRIDADATTPYVLTPELSSRLVLTDGQSEAQRTIALRGARIEITNAVTGAAFANANGAKGFTSLFAASLSPGGKTSVAFDLIPKAILQQTIGTADVELLAKITVFGSLGGGGDDIDAVPFYYPVTACNECTIAIVVGACPLPAGSATGKANACNVNQDSPVVCCTETTGITVCPGRTGT